MERPKFSFVSITFPEAFLNKINASLILHQQRDLTQLAIDYPREAYCKLIFQAINFNKPKDVMITVDNKQLEPDPSVVEEPTPASLNQYEKIPDIDITPVQMLISVWGRLKLIETIKTRRVRRVSKPILNFVVEPPDLAF